MPIPKHDPDREFAILVLALLGQLVHGWSTGDLDEAADARAALRDLGVVVRLPRRPSMGGRTDAN